MYLVQRESRVRERAAKLQWLQFGLRRFCLSACVWLVAQAGYSQQSGGIFSLGISDDAVVQFTWRSNSEPDLAGYRLYIGTTPGVYTGFVDVGRATTFDLPGLVRGMTYYFALAACNTAGVESELTPEITRQIPVVPTTVQAPQEISTQELVGMVNSPPAISAIPDQALSKNRPSDPLPFTVGDLEASADALQVTACSSNPLVVPSSGMLLEGSDSNRTLVIDPMNGQSGWSLITITVTDGAASTTMSFLVTVMQRAEAEN